MPATHADNDNNTLIPNNKRLNDGVIVNVYTAQREAGCNHDVNPNPQLQLAAQWHTDDLMNNRNLDGHIGSDGSTPQDRGNAAGYHGKVAETVAINPALAINGMDVLHQWFNDPAAWATMTDCANSQVGVWSENSLNRTVLVAVYGQPDQPPPSHQPPQPTSQPPQPLDASEANSPVAMDPTPDYDASDELEKLQTWLPWILRGRSPSPAYPPQ
ncbi:CAP domain-containing protein [Mycobacterium sp. 050134]|uniref:CAP domain-containing protein n=1 Tax=Mycobacterium sp. 050134 TaxID=3096111 RepID=UPI002ED7F027